MLTRLRVTPWLLLAVLLPAAVAYQTYGLYCLVVDMTTAFPMDLRVRWNEQRHLYSMVGVEVPDPGPAASPMARGVMGHRLVSYPPWTYTTNVLFFPPIEWQAVRYYHALLNVLAMGLMGYWAYRAAAEWGAQARWLAVASLLAMFPIAICVSYGQYGLLVTACLIACLLLCEKGWDCLAGLCLGVALVKPQLSGLFVLGLLVRGRYRVALTAVAYLLAASAVLSVVLRRTPLELLAIASRDAQGYYLISHNPLIILLTDAIGLRPATLLLAAVGSVVCSALVWRYGRARPLIITFSICAVVSMFWSYRRHYDTELLAFPFLALFLLSCRTQSRLAAAAFILFGLTVWTPMRLPQWEMPVVQYTVAAVWVFGLTVFLALQGRQAQSDAAPDSESQVALGHRRCAPAASTASP
jgi:hypothetical protein